MGKVNVRVTVNSQQKGWKMTAEQASVIHMFESGQLEKLGKSYPEALVNLI